MELLGPTTWSLKMKPIKQKAEPRDGEKPSLADLIQAVKPATPEAKLALGFLVTWSNSCPASFKPIWTEFLSQQKGPYLITSSTPEWQTMGKRMMLPLQLRTVMKLQSDLAHQWVRLELWATITCCNQQVTQPQFKPCKLLRHWLLELPLNISCLCLSWSNFSKQVKRKSRVQWGSCLVIPQT